MEFERVTEIAGKYVSLGNIYINKTVEFLPPALRMSINGLLIILSIIASALVPCPAKALYITETACLSIGCAGMGSQTLGQVSIGRHHFSGIVFLALFALIFYSPLPDKMFDRCSDLLLSGRVLMGNSPLKGAKVWLPEHAREDITNARGEFDIRLDHKIDQELTKVHISFNHIDTEIALARSVLDMDEMFLVPLPDTITTLNREISKKVILEEIHSFRKAVLAAIHTRMLEFEGTETGLAQICNAYRGYERISANYRNEFEFEGYTTHLEYRKNLLENGISQAAQPEPYLAHQIKNHQAMLLMLDTSNKPRFIMDYVFLNKDTTCIRNLRLEKISHTSYKAFTELENNLLAVSVHLEHSNHTDFLKKRRMTFYGFLPQEEFTLQFEEGKWKIEPLKRK